MKAKRAYLTPREMQAMLAAQGGVCFASHCGSAGPFIGEHWFPVALGNASKPDCLLCVPCAKKKTNGLRGDISTIAKVKRIANGRTQYDKRSERGSKLKSGGFKGWRRMNGDVVKNDR
jgi:hypothetical protein